MKDKGTLMKACEVRARDDKYLARVEHAEKTLADHDGLMVSYSGGKDSLVMTHIMMRIDDNVPVFHWDYGIFMPRDLEGLVIENARAIGVKNLHVRARESTREECAVGYSAFFSALKEVSLQLGISKHAIGLRKEESAKRVRTIRQGKDVYPLADWKWLDVWTYIFSHDVPYPKVYDEYARIYGYDRARFVTFFDKEFDNLGASYVDGVFLPKYRRAF